MMLDALKFVQGAIGKKDFIPALKHFKIENGFIHSFDGTIALCSPIPIDLNCMPKAIPFFKAISNCTNQVSMVLRDNGKLNIKSGRFSVNIDCLNEEHPFSYPNGEEFYIDGVHLLEAVKILEPFVGNDASRIWSNGILFDKQSAYATNNVILVEYWMGSEFPIRCNVPLQAIRELSRINEAPERIQCDDNTITFHFKNNRWLKTSQYVTDWPDLNKILNRESKQVYLQKEFFDALEYVKPFLDDMGQLYIYDNVISTKSNNEEGARYELMDKVGDDIEAIYQLSMLEKLNGIAQSIDFSSYPNPSIFFGANRIRGAIIGMKNL